MDMRLQLACDAYEKMIKDGTIEWVPVDKSVLHPSTVHYLEKVIEPSGITYMMAKDQLHKTALFKLNHTTICYFHHDPVTLAHLWADESFVSSLPNNLVMVTFIAMAEMVAAFKPQARTMHGRNYLNN